MNKKTNLLWVYMLILSISLFSLSGCGEVPAQTEPFIESSAEPQTPAITEAATEPTTEVSGAPVTEAATESVTEPTTQSPADPATEVTTLPSTEPMSDAPTVAPLTINDVAFIGDSRTLTMTTGGRYEFNLIPASSVFATWGGELTQDSAKQNAQAAATADRDVAIFWYGINDVQSDPEQKLAPQFVANYEAIIDLYCNINPNSKIVILSILSTSVHEKDYYEGQEENILRYNSELAALCAEKGYTYLDITELFTSDECLAPDDYIHFSKDWYVHSFLPEVCSTLGIDR